MPSPNRATKVVAGLTIGGAALVSAMNQWERPPAEIGGGSVVYADKLAHGIPTVCSGHTDWHLKVGAQLTKDECDSLDAADSEKYALAIIKCSGHTDTHPVLNQHELDAHTLRAINIGIAGECGSRSITLLKQGKHKESCDALAHGPHGEPVWSYVNGGATFVRGLYNRRLFERSWCLEPMPAPQPTERATA